MKKNNLPRIKEVLLQSHRIVITTHVNPDGDGLSSELALYLFLKKLGKDVVIMNRDTGPEMFAFLPGMDDIQVSERPPLDADLIVVTDCGGLDRTGLKLSDTHNPRLVVIDHHLTNDHTGEINLLDSDASATGELVYYLLREMEEDGLAKIDSPIALCLYTSIFTDTGSFRYSNTSSKALDVASKLLAYGINSWDVAEHVYESRSFEVLKLTGLFMKTMGVSRDGKFAWGSVLKEYYQKTGTRDEHTDGFVNYPRSIKGVEVAILFREVNGDSIKISMRSKGKINVAALAEKFDGGGHHNAAGCVIKGTLKEVQGKVLHIVARSLMDEVPEEYGVELVG
jgi:phosphoesterase RecJ-like protein